MFAKDPSSSMPDCPEMPQGFDDEVSFWFTVQNSPGLELEDAGVWRRLESHPAAASAVGVAGGAAEVDSPDEEGSPITEVDVGMLPRCPWKRENPVQNGNDVILDTLAESADVIKYIAEVAVVRRENVLEFTPSERHVSQVEIIQSETTTVND